MLGLEIRWKDNAGEVLQTLFQGINTYNVVWEVEDAEVYEVDQTKSARHMFSRMLFEVVMPDVDLREKINKKNYFVISFIFRGYLQHTMKRIKMDSYDAFLQSKCQISIWWFDSIYCEVYAKDSAVLQQMYANAQNLAEEIRCVEKEDEIGRVLF